MLSCNLQSSEAAVNTTDERKKVPWSDSETLILLELWGDEKVQRNLQRCPHNGHIYSEISEQLNAHGYSRTSEQCHTRIKRLKLSYRQCRESMRQVAPSADVIDGALTLKPLRSRGKAIFTGSNISCNFVGRGFSQHIKFFKGRNATCD